MKEWIDEWINEQVSQSVRAAGGSETYELYSSAVFDVISRTQPEIIIFNYLYLPKNYLIQQRSIQHKSMQPLLTKRSFLLVLNYITGTPETVSSGVEVKGHSTLNLQVVSLQAHQLPYGYGCCYYTDTVDCIQHEGSCQNNFQTSSQRLAGTLGIRRVSGTLQWELRKLRILSLCSGNSFTVIGRLKGVTFAMIGCMQISSPQHVRSSQI